MLFAAETLKVLCAATQEFANLKITSTAQVESAMKRHIKPLMRDVTYPNGKELKAEFWSLNSGQTETYRKDQATLRQLLTRFEDLSIRKEHPRSWNEAAAQLRKDAGATLQRLLFGTVTEFGVDGRLLLRPVKFGVENTIYLALAGMLEPDAACRVRRCELGQNLNVETERCKNFIVHAGGRGQPPKFCSRPHAQKHRNLKNRKEI